MGNVFDIIIDVVIYDCEWDGFFCIVINIVEIIGLLVSELDVIVEVIVVIE